MFHGQEYWGRPLPSFGDPEARLLVLGLAPAAHGASYQLAGFPRLFACYHPSQQNTQTGKLTTAMMRNVLEDIRAFLRSPTDDEN